jgi:hypothetical protein
MLGNLKTPGRNIIGNVIAAAEYRGKDTVGTLLEVIANKVSGGKIGRTKSLFVSKPLMEAGRKDFQNFKRTIQSGGKFGENVSASAEFEQGIQDRRRIFKGNVRTGNDAFNQVANRVIDTALFPMETYRIATDRLMNNQYFGDEAFGREAYARALAGYLQANGVKDADLSKVDSALLDKARAYAIREAQESTFHDNSAFARILSKLKKDTGVVGEGLMPFTRTPANVFLRAEEFSPLGFINTAVMSAKKAKGNTTITVNLIGLQNAAGKYGSRMSFALLDEESEIITISTTDNSIERADDILATIVDVYNEIWVREKNKEAEGAKEFIEGRLAYINEELDSIDDNISSFKSENLIPDIKAQSNINITAEREITRRKASVRNIQSYRPQ